MQRPVLETYDGISVVRDDLIPGGSKSRFILPWMRAHPAREFVYATPPEGGAQIALAMAAYQTGHGLTLFTAARRHRTINTRTAAGYGIRIVEVRPGYFSVVQARARAHAARHHATLIPFGLGIAGAADMISDAALSLKITPDEVWCAAGSGVLATGLRRAWPAAAIMPVRVGCAVAGAKFTSPLPFSTPHPVPPPFPSNPWYDAKAWHICRHHHGPGAVLFWNVAA